MPSGGACFGRKEYLRFQKKKKYIERFRDSNIGEDDLEFTEAMDLETLGIIFALDTLDHLIESCA